MPGVDFHQAHKGDISYTDFPKDSLSEVDVLGRYVSIVIEDTVVHAFVDTGADVSVISEGFRMFMPTLCRKPILKQFIPLTGVTGDSLDSVGSVTVNLNIAHISMTHTIQVVRNCTKPLILGWDFLVSKGVIVNPRKMSLLIGEKVVPLVSPKQYVPKLTELTVSSTVTIPPMSEMVISAKLDSSLKGLVPTGYVGVFEPYYSTQASTGFAWTIAKAEQGFTNVKVAW